MASFIDQLNDRDDMILSQVLDDIEILEKDNTELSQALDLLEYKDLLTSSTLTDSQFSDFLNDSVEDDSFGIFSLELPSDEKCELLAAHGEKRNRFGKSINNADLDELVKNQKSKNTDRSTKWASSVFESWRNVCRENGEDIPPLEQCDVNIHLSR
jgi:hypothetical protein